MITSQNCPSLSASASLSAAEPPADINNLALASLTLNGGPRLKLMPGSAAGLLATTTVYLSLSAGGLWHFCCDACHPVKCLLFIFSPWSAQFFSFFSCKKTKSPLLKKTASQWPELALWVLVADHHQLCWCKRFAQTLKSLPASTCNLLQFLLAFVCLY